MALSNLVALAIMLTAGASFMSPARPTSTVRRWRPRRCGPSRASSPSHLRIGNHRHRVHGCASAGRICRVCRWRGATLAGRTGASAQGSPCLLRHAGNADSARYDINFLPFDPIRALYWSAVINGVMVAPIIVVMMNLATDPRVMGRFTLSSWLKIVGWITAAVMALCVVGWFASLGL